jgi:hypothetical protein
MSAQPRFRLCPAVLFAALIFIPGIGTTNPVAAGLQPKTIQAWNTYLQWADQKVQRELSSESKFLIEQHLPPQKAASVRRSLEAGEIVVDRMTGVVPAGTHFSIEDGMIHHWWGAILIPNVTLDRVIQFLQDYDHHAGRFADVEQSRILSRDGQHFRVFLRVRRSAALVTAFYNTEQDCSYRLLGPRRVYSYSTAIRIAELADPGTPREREKPPGEDRGFLWRLASWWRIEETDRGVIVEVESASLSRDIPTLVLLIPGVSSYINSIPRESIKSILTSIRIYFSGPTKK